jgi:hypothetical protein
MERSRSILRAVRIVAATKPRTAPTAMQINSGDVVMQISLDEFLQIAFPNAPEATLTEFEATQPAV